MSATFTCLGHDFSVSASDPVMQSLVERLFAPFASSAEPEVHYTVVEWDALEPPAFAVYVDAQRTRTTDDPTIALAHLIWEVNRNAIAGSATSLLLHAAAAERGGRAVLLPAPSGWGKSTTVAGLVARGFGYLTDDVSVLDASGVVQPYPKPIALARRLRRLFPDLEVLPKAADRYLGEEGFVTPEDLGGQVGQPSVIGLVVIPRYSADAANRLVELPRSECLRLLVEQSFNIASLGTTALPTLSRCLEGCGCYRLEYRDLPVAVELVASALHEGAPDVAG